MGEGMSAGMTTKEEGENTIMRRCNTTGSA